MNQAHFQFNKRNISFFSHHLLHRYSSIVFISFFVLYLFVHPPKLEIYTHIKICTQLCQISYSNAMIIFSESVAITFTMSQVPPNQTRGILLIYIFAFYFPKNTSLSLSRVFQGTTTQLRESHSRMH